MRILEVTDLHKSYRSGGKTVDAVRGVSFGISAGEVFSFLGPNGAGKTTTIKMIAGLIEPSRGQVTVSGMDPSRQREATRRIGAVLEGSRNIYWRLSPLENLVYFGALRGVPTRVAKVRGMELLERFGLADRCDSEVRTLSRGNQQKVAIAVSVLHEPTLLLLDEPTLGLDVRASEDVKRLVREMAAEGRAILLTTHQLTVAEEIGHQVAVIRDGRLVVQGGMSSVLAGFSKSAYRVHFQGEPDGLQREALARMQVEVEGGSLLYFGPPEGLYQVLAVLHPLELVSVARDQASLTDVFLQLTHEKARA